MRPLEGCESGASAVVSGDLWCFFPPVSWTSNTQSEMILLSAAQIHNNIANAGTRARFEDGNGESR